MFDRNTIKNSNLNEEKKRVLLAECDMREELPYTEDLSIHTLYARIQKLHEIYATEDSQKWNESA